VRKQIATEVSQVMTTHHDVVHGRDRFRGLVCGNTVDNAFENVSTRDAERHLHVFFFDLVASETDHLVQC